MIREHRYRKTQQGPRHGSQCSDITETLSILHTRFLTSHYNQPHATL